MLTLKQRELLAFIEGRLDQAGVSPSFEEMKEALGLRSKSGIHRLIRGLEERGVLRRLPNRARALEVLTPLAQIMGEGRLGQARPVPAAANDIVELPLHGRIAAGLPIEAFEDFSSLPVPAALLGPGEHYALEVAGDSMIEAGILDGDYALVQKAEAARDGDIVVALVDGVDATLKYWRRDDGQIRLDPANSAYSPQRYPEQRVKVQGRLAGILRRYH